MQYSLADAPMLPRISSQRPPTPRLKKLLSSPQPIDAVAVEYRIDRHDRQVAG